LPENTVLTDIRNSVSGGLQKRKSQKTCDKSSQKL